VHQFTLVHQINRVERELGMTLLPRAERGHPMTLTAQRKSQLVAVRVQEVRVAALIHRGWWPTARLHWDQPHLSPLSTRCIAA
jgi:hypothetical protein